MNIYWISKKYFLVHVLSFYIIDLIPSSQNENIGNTESCFLISTAKNFAGLLNEGRISKIAMIIVDNGHTFLESSDDSMSTVLEFMRTNVPTHHQKEKDGTVVDVRQQFPCWQSRAVVFTANFLLDSQSNSQLVEVDREFGKLTELYTGNKVMK